MSREQYVAGAIQSLSQSVLRKSLADIFPALIGTLVRKATHSESVDPLQPEILDSADATPVPHTLGAADEIEKLARVIANPNNSHLKT